LKRGYYSAQRASISRGCPQSKRRGSSTSPRMAHKQRKRKEIFLKKVGVADTYRKRGKKRGLGLKRMILVERNCRISLRETDS